MTFHLETLGGLRLIAADGRAIDAQRRRLALLALLAAAGERGLTRDQVAGCLWAEATEEKARHALNQLLYGIRRALGEAALPAVDPLRLDPTLVDSDVERFQRALAAGAHADAVAVYRGPFLDGFYLPNAPEFERRVEQERARLAAAYGEALDRLATDAEDRGDAHDAVRRRRMLVELDRLDARRAIAFMRALVAAGDSSGALAHGRTHESLVREELDAPADPAVVALANEIRAGTERPAASAPAPVAAAPRALPMPERPAGADAASSGSGRAPAARSGRRWVWASGVAAVVVAATVFGARQWPRPGAGPSIAVLAMKNTGMDAGDAALADGMTEDLIAMLSRMGSDRLRVVASTSVLPLRDRRLDVRQIAESLRVSHVLESTVQKDGLRVRIQVRLIDAKDGTTIWAETYNRQTGDIFAIQDDIAQAVTRELDVRLAGGARRDSVVRRYRPNIDAYEWYRRGMDLALWRSNAGRQQAIANLNRAIAADSNFAAAYAGLADLYLQEVGVVPGNEREMHARAEQAARRAVALDDGLAESHSALGWAMIVRNEWPAIEAELKRAVALDPRAFRGYEGLARMYMWTGRPVEQLAAARIGLDVNPYSVAATRELALALAGNGRCDEALELLRPTKSLNPPARVAGVVGGQCHAAAGRWPEAIAEFQWAMDGDAKSALAFLGYALARAGQRDSAQRILVDLLAGRKYSHGPFGIAIVYAGLGDRDQAFAWLDKAADELTVRAYIMGPMFEELRRDARFARFRRRMATPIPPFAARQASSRAGQKR